MKNFKILLIHEVLQQIKSFKFIVLFTVAVVLSLSVGYLRVNNYKEKYNTYMVENKAAQERLKEAQVYSELEIAVFAQPNPLSVFAKGIDDKVGNKIIVSATHYPGIQSTSQKANLFLNLFSDIDITGIVKLFSIFIILMTAGVIAGEREDETLKIIFTNNVSRIEYFLSKYISISIVAFSSVIVIFLIPTLMILFGKGISSGSNLISNVIYLLGVSFLYISAFVLLSLLLSAKSQTSSQAVMTALFIWLGITFIYPQLTSSLATRIHKTPSKVVLQSEIKQIDRDFRKKNFDYILKNRELRPTYSNYYSTFSQDNGRSSLLGVTRKVDMTQKYFFEHSKKNLDYQISNLWERHNVVRSIEDNYKNSLLKQASLFDLLNFLMPDFELKKISENIALTSREQREEAFHNAAIVYRESLIEYIRSKNGFGYSFFTQTPEEVMKDDYSAYTDEDLQRSSNMKQLKTDDIPTFYFKPRRALLRGITILLVLNLILFVSGSARFYKSKFL